MSEVSGVITKFNAPKGRGPAWVEIDAGEERPFKAKIWPTTKDPGSDKGVENPALPAAEKKLGGTWTYYDREESFENKDGDHVEFTAHYLTGYEPLASGQSSEPSKEAVWEGKQQDARTPVGASRDSRSASFALSYAKDLMVGLIACHQWGYEDALARTLDCAEQMKAWLDQNT